MKMRAKSATHFVRTALSTVNCLPDEAVSEAGQLTHGASTQAYIFETRE